MKKHRHKSFIFSAICSLALLTLNTPLFAAEGGITFYNASDRSITAEVRPYGKINLDAKEQKLVSYSTLRSVCSSNPTHCKAHFYVDNAPAGSATINAVTGKLVNVDMDLDVHTKQNQKVLRAVILK